MSIQLLKKELFFIILISLIIAACSMNENDDKSPEAVYLDNVHQIIRGFGAANILPWRPDMTADEINKAFGTGDGQIGFSLLRLRVPSDTAEFSLNVPTALAAHSMLREFEYLALHAARLSFRHPASGDKMLFRSPLPPRITGLLAVLRGES